MIEPIRLGVLGGNRGGAFKKYGAALDGVATIAALCDQSAEVRETWRNELPGIRLYDSFANMTDDAEIEAVFIATPISAHAGHIVAALQAGKHVLCEVPAVATVEDCWRLVETTRQSNKVFMMAENFGYSRSNMLLQNMIEQGCFGSISYAECGYIQELCSMTHNPDGSMTWRGEVHRTNNSSSYPTHALGPVSQWLGGDRLIELSSFSSPVVALPHYFREEFGKDHPAASKEYWRQGDSNVTLVRSESGALVVLRVDWTSLRPYNTLQYSLQGELGAYLSGRYLGESPLVFVEGDTRRVPGHERQWSSLWDFAERFEHPRWRALGTDKDEPLGQWWDFLMLEDFVGAIRSGDKPPYDEVQAAVLSSVVPLSAASIASGGAPVKIPLFEPSPVA